jgi:uridine kinase
LADRLVIGICGGTGSGKTTIANRIISALSPGNALILQPDHYYKDLNDLPLERSGQRNFDHPDSFDTPLLVEHLRLLKNGQAVDRPAYDCSKHARAASTVRLSPSPAILLEGILIFENKQLRDLMDVKIFVDTEADIRFIRRLRRDIRERNRTVEFVIEQYLATVRPMHVEFIEHSRRWADVIITGGGRNDEAIDLIIEKIRSLVASAPENASTTT